MGINLRDKRKLQRGGQLEGKIMIPLDRAGNGVSRRNLRQGVCLALRQVGYYHVNGRRREKAVNE
jgi:predicted methyltransferase